MIDQDEHRASEAETIRENRFLEARAAGLDALDAQEFADGDTDIGLLRRLVRDGCRVDLIARIVV